MQPLDELSPFNLVFGRKPRLSAVDMCFPVKQLPLPLPDEPTTRKYMQMQHKTLEGLRFRAQDSAVEAKEGKRVQHDNDRGRAFKTSPNRQLMVGDIISICRPTRNLRKLSFQWSEPNFVVVSVQTATVNVRDLTQKGGINRKQLAKSKRLSSIVVNKKMTRSFRVPDSFFIGAQVAKRFSGKWYVGKVTDVQVDEEETL